MTDDEPDYEALRERAYMTAVRLAPEENQWPRVDEVSVAEHAEAFKRGVQSLTTDASRRDCEAAALDALVVAAVARLYVTGGAGIPKEDMLEDLNEELEARVGVDPAALLAEAGLDAHQVVSLAARFENLRHTWREDRVPAYVGDLIGVAESAAAALIAMTCVV